MPHPIRAVIFDLDGTLVDHTGAVRAALRAWLPTLGATPTAGAIAAWFTAEARHFPSWEAGHITHAEQRRRRLRDFLPAIGRPAGDDGHLDEVFAGYFAHYESSWSAFPDVDPALHAVAATGLPIAVLTNGTEHNQHAKLAAAGLRDRVGPVFTAEALGAAKPSPATYLTVCAHLGVAPADTLHIGDRHDLDVLAARAAGLQAVHLDRTSAGPHSEPARITTLADLPALLA